MHHSRSGHPGGKRFGHDGCTCLPIRYSSGNRKIQTMSTKCQYSPLTSIGFEYSRVIVPFHDQMNIQVMMPSPMIMCRACSPVITKYNEKKIWAFLKYFSSNWNVGPGTWCSTNFS